MLEATRRKYVSQQGIVTLQSVMKKPECKRGIKAVQKCLVKKNEGVVILAADVTPSDLISHIPGLCMEGNTPLFYISSRFDLRTDKDKPTTCLFIPKGLLSESDAQSLQ
ncbi:H/ACA ribonucleoprotein complex subunit 2 [Nematocida major]|uniref:H/ACA ribonucleoprotein complex subunit 2 n=1 Tax=Nematocida major TaxID=1912982 RepID=UPI00200860C9|nr:H/ACA ribonucleoprotein complex subunit 2 [Nematocida major]KAH9386197.1 H/ACA ribonucleoprotein complex subunit 2 [Nematocida major]